MIPIQHSTLVLLCVLSGIGLVCAAWGGAQILDRSARSLALRRIRRRVDESGPRFVRKLVRHAVSGRVGLCVGVGYQAHPRWGIYRAHVILQVVFCTHCCRAVTAGEFPDVNFRVAMRPGHAELLDARELVAALPAEIEAFRAEMERSCE